MSVVTSKKSVHRDKETRDILSAVSGTAPLLAVSKSLPHSIGRHFLPQTPNYAMVERYAPPQLFPPPVLVAVWCLLAYGVRVSELLSAKFEQIGGADAVHLKGTKKSLDRTIYIPGITSWACSLDVMYLDAYIFGFTYAQLYGYMRRANLGHLLPKHKNVCRTHLGRHLVADRARRNGGDAAVTAALGHVKDSTQAYYGIETHGTVAPTPPRQNKPTTK